ncbi:MAG: hypothetical protein L0Z50_20875, partial [Verrucomicrobiales bacterium]|nr:hypothetical protein [Verrucomicrobiales bacterium]
ANSELALAEARLLAGKIGAEAADNDAQFVTSAFARILARRPTEQELRVCLDFLGATTEQVKSADGQALAKVKFDAQTTGSHSSARSRENLILVLFNHNDFVTVR